MRVIILHLSDIHIGKGANLINTRVKKIADVLNSYTEKESTCFLTISGDIANSGKSSEYDIAYDFIYELLEEIRTNKQIKEVYPILVPGNHDCNFDIEKSTRRDLIKLLFDAEDPLTTIDIDYVQDLTNIQQEFFKFAEKLDDLNHETNRLYWIQGQDIDEYRLNFLCLNTAWISQEKEEQGKLVFPAHLINLDQLESDKPSVNITLFHHPVNWFNTRHLRYFKNLIQSTSNIVITGHEHDIDIQTNISITGKIQENMQGGLLQYGKKAKSSFNVEILDMQQRMQKKALLVWDDKENLYVPEDETPWLSFLSLETKHSYTVTKEHQRQLNRLDVQLTNPNNLKLLEMDDVFIDPSLDVSYAKKGIISKTTETINNINQLLKAIKECRKVIILGNKYFGKTLLLKKIYKTLLEEDYIPLLCNEKNFSKLGTQTESYIKYLFNNQYENEKDVPFQKYRQEGPDRKVILIDNLSKTELAINKIESILDALQGYFGIIVIASHPIISVSEVFNNPSGLIDYTRLRINDFSLPMVSDIVERWARLVHPDDPEPYIQHRIKEVEHRLFNQMHKDITPRNPFFVLTILHKLETEKSPEAQTGSYGYYFQTIINVMVAKTSDKPGSIGYVHDFFANLAFQMLDNKTGKIARDELDQISESYLERTGFTLDIPKIIDNSLREEILVFEEDQYSFAKNYYFEYFAAQYISDHLRSEKLQSRMGKTLEQIILHIHKEVYTEILMFLCFHSKDPIIVDSIIEKAKQIWGENPDFDINRDVEFLNKLSPKAKILYLAEKSREETKKEMLELRDDVSVEVGEIRYSLLQDIKELNDLSPVSRIMYALSLVKVLGQIQKRDIPGDLDARISLTKECYDIGINTIKYVFDAIETTIPDVESNLAASILERNPTITNTDLGAATVDWIWALSESVCLVSIKNISHHVGAHELNKIYKAILKKYPSIAYEFIDISIELDHFEMMPESKIVGLGKKLDELKNYFCKDLLCLLFMNHIYQYYEPLPQIQRVASALGLQHITSQPNIFLPNRKLLPKKSS